MSNFLRRVQRGAYLTSRAAGDAAAFQSSGAPRLAKRVARRIATRTAFGLLRKVIR